MLSAGRPVAFGPGPIPASDILMVGEVHGFPLPWFYRMMRALDHEFLLDSIDKKKSKEKAAPPPRRKR